MEATRHVMEEPQHINASRLSTLDWTSEETLDTRTRLQSFEEDWNAPGTEYYDNL